ncbi:MAG: RNA polymerase factor sigma-54 [candidate division Zixibacteria bacterium]|nr:RNA polymerase factor sigma-54 [candidate division Zixibacteria bacterium]
MKLGLQIKLSQKMTLAPQLIQSLKMVQAPVLKLEQMLRLELATNPMLEEIEELELETTDNDEDELDMAEEKDSDKDEIDWDEFLFDDDEGYKVREQHEHDETRFEGSATRTESLYDYLLEQLNFLKLTDEQHLIGEYIVGNIDTHGYLTISVAEMAVELELEEGPIEEILAMIRTFDPSGVGSRDLRESLLIQLEERKLKNSLAYRIADEHIHDLEKKSTLQIARLMGVPFERAQKALEVVKSLSPTPAHGRFDTAAMPVAPDLLIEKVGSNYEVFLNDKNVPRLRINSGYKQLMRRGSKTSKDTKDYVRSKLEQARWLLNALNQRRATMIRVMSAIVEEQSEFFEKGKAFLKPLIMEDIAQIVGMNVATISRVASGKYVQTPLGVYEIKYFFNTGISRDDGEDMSKRSVKQRISEIIDTEDQVKPFSDQEIFRRLNDEGIKLARRTVTKYREELGIKAARFRKTVVV